eukprot:TRINITY_DN16204_c0_g1_i2.p1 TRINITY_DN16204_c0_g1~~TRINITY_DN16204_c0_g1_i2.p1  ORF type:complete len:293 (-),score=52.78 TRINITY_DN16204_c0_g1_i2:92-970(-)
MSSAAGVRLVASAIGAGLAEAATLPADVAKVRLQIQSSALGDERYHGIVDCLVKVAKVEGVSALWKGIVPALIRQVSYHSFTFVLYEPIRDMVGSTLGYAAGEVNYVQKVLCAGVSAAIAISIFNPTEVIKTQMQSAAASVSMAEVIRKVYSKSGIQGFWAGLRPNVARTFLVNGAEIGTYDEAKLLFVALVGDGLAAHLGASFVAGLTSACVAIKLSKDPCTRQLPSSKAKALVHCTKDSFSSLAENFFGVWSFSSCTKDSWQLSCSFSETLSRCDAAKCNGQLLTLDTFD